MLKNFRFDIIPYHKITIGNLIFYSNVFGYSFVCDGDHNKVIVEDVLYIKDEEKDET